jgi:N-acetyl-anhydromuramyl-L-alanine amidase AmpD
MSNSKLVDYTNISPNKNPRKDATYNPSGKVIKITPHHVAGNVTVERLGESFAKESRQASSNYGIGTDGRVGLYVPEDCRAWTSGGKGSDRGKANDFLAVTIEVANDGGAPDWHVSDKALAKLIDLCVDICQRNGIKKLNYTGDASGNLTRHNMFAATTCPGPYLQSKFPYIAEEVNKRIAKEEKPEENKVIYRVQVGAYSSLESAEKMAARLQADGYPTVIKEEIIETEPAPIEPWTPKVGDIVYFKGGKHYSNANATEGTQAAAGEARISKIVDGKKHPYSLVRTGKTGPYGWVDAGSFTKV